MIDFTTLTLVDYGIVLVFILSATMSILRGLTREILGLAGWGVSILIANYSAPLIEGPIVDLLQVKGLGAALAWGLPFAASVVIWFILASLIAPGLKRVGFGSLDRWLGVLFGFVRGYGLVLIVFVAAVFAVEGEDNLPETVTGNCWLAVDAEPMEREGSGEIPPGQSLTVMHLHSIEGHLWTVGLQVWHIGSGA